MGTKANPSKYDCYVKAEPDEPIFVLRAKDPLAPAVVRWWVFLRTLNTTFGKVLGVNVDEADEKAKMEEANNCAADMDSWRTRR